MNPQPALGTVPGGEPEVLLWQVYRAWQADWAQWQADRAELAAAREELARAHGELQAAGAQIAQLTARVEELEKPAKTPENCAPWKGTALQRVRIPPGNCRSSRYVEYFVRWS